MDDWKLTCVGRVEQLEELDTDKSGKRPRIKYYYSVRADEATAEAPDAVLPDVLTFGVDARDLRRMTRQTPQVGDRVRMVGKASGISPAHVLLTAVQTLPD